MSDSSPYTPCQDRGSIQQHSVGVHVLSGNDAVSKVGTKHAELTCNPFSLTNFAETGSLTTVDIRVVERYIVKVWAGACSNTAADTFEKFRHDSYVNGKALTDLPLTWSVICGHIRRCFCVIRNAFTLLETH